MMLSAISSSLRFLLLLLIFFVAQIRGDAMWTIKAMDDSNHYSITIDDLCRHADDFDDCRNFIGRLIEMETEQEQSRRDGDGTLFTYHHHHHLRKAKIRRRLNEEPNNNNFRFYLINIGGATFSVSLVAMISAMFLGYLTLDPLDLQIKMRAALDPTEREAAACIFPLVNQNHRLMITLLVMNSLAYECLPLFVDKLMPTWMTIVFSVTLLLVFGEIIPTAIFTGPDQLMLASKLAPLVSASMTLLHPITYPLVKLLDKVVPSDESDDGEEYNRAELSALVRIQFEERLKAQMQKETADSMNIKHTPKPRTAHKGLHMANQLQTERQRQQQLMNDSYFNSSHNWRKLKTEMMEAVTEKQLLSSDSSGNLFGSLFDVNEHKEANEKPSHRRNPSNSSASTTTSVDHPFAFDQIAPPMERTEVRAVEGALNLKTMCALDVYTPIRQIYAVPNNLELSKQNIAEIYGQGYSRVPVYDPQGKDCLAMVGILMTRQLIMIDWDDERTVSSLPIYIPPCVSPRMNLIRLLHLLREGGSLIAFVCAGPHIAERALEDGRAIPPEAGFMGLVTLQDVFESVIQERIYDEEDVSERNLASAVLTNWAATVLQRFAKRQQLKRANSVDSSAYQSQSGPREDNDRVLTHEGTPLLKSPWKDNLGPPSYKN